MHLQDLKFRIAQALMPKTDRPVLDPLVPDQRIILGGDVEENLGEEN